ncbi:MAG: hypothetical protein JRJ59_01290 [Deltaproteobacteria bacterium]|nr:hypothetical protein [Deltaproteobacteria bacterium]
MRGKTRSVWLELAALPLLAALLAGLTYVLIPPRPQTGAAPAQAESSKNLEPVGLEKALKLHRQKAVFVDVRAAGQYAQGHIPGALKLSQGQPLPSGPVVVYGQGPDLDQVIRAGEKLLGRTRGPVFVFIEGLDGWQAAGQDLERGEQE